MAPGLPGSNQAAATPTLPPFTRLKTRILVALESEENNARKIASVLEMTHLPRRNKYLPPSRSSVGGYKDLRRRQNAEASEPEAPRVRKKKLYKEAREAGQTRELSFKGSKELEPLSARIESLEGEMNVLHNQLDDPAFYRNPDNVVPVKKRLAELEARHAQAFERGEHLESI
jgi:hypothetical protein